MWQGLRLGGRPHPLAVMRMQFYSVVNTLVIVASLAAFIGFGIYLLVAVKHRAAQLGAAGLGVLVVGQLVGALLPWFIQMTDGYADGFPYVALSLASLFHLLVTLGGIGLLVMGIATAVRQLQSQQGRYGAGATSAVTDPSAPTGTADAPWPQ